MGDVVPATCCGPAAILKRSRSEGRGIFAKKFWEIVINSFGVLAIKFHGDWGSAIGFQGCMLQVSE